MGLNLPLLAVFVLLGGQKPTDPEDALRRSFDRKAATNVEAVIEKRIPGGSIKLRMWRDPQGRSRTEVLYPIAMQGRVFVDDGTNWMVYFPDGKLLKIHPSPPSEGEDLDFRMRQVRRNYRLEIDARTTIAGRPAFRVVATPRDAALDTRRFYLDTATCTPLKVESSDSLGNVAVEFTVRRIDFPSRLDKDTFEPPKVEGVQRVVGKAPVRVKDPQEIARRIGFAPALPRRLPMGFRSQGMDLLDWKNITPLAINLTDGLVKVNVFQFRVPSAPAPPPRPGEGPRVTKDVGDVRIEVRGDNVPVAVRERLLAFYVRLFEGRMRSQEP